MKSLVAVLIPMSIALPAHAQVSRQAMAACAAITDDITRLQCFDELADRHRITGMDVPAASVEGVGKWRVSKSTNPLDDSSTVVAVLTATSGAGIYGDPVTLVVRCRSNETEFYIDWNSYMTDSVRVTTRVGSADAISAQWSASSDKESSFSRRAIPLLKEMLEATRFIAQATPYNQNPITAIFETSGMPNAISGIREECGW
ncbi:hypothetical protein PS2015_1953 [Pseudohongiella spirulinae]|uniref:Type VI secretion protein n=2 Tax=Pseudohongiella spirulinae TaxID=1249552 RepID=A0A0S2KER4_9GAMM|nr:hypothetical protein PS2015_1953 [Pseudohongiella spirulinae]